MILTIISIKNRIVKCQSEKGIIIDIARRWFTDDIREGDKIEVKISDSKAI